MSTEAMVFYRAEALLAIHADDILLLCRAEDYERLVQDLAKHLRINWDEHPLSDQWVRYLGRELRRIPTGFEIRIPPAY